ncbi:transcriptional regulator of RNA polII, SAGA, subunit-domain-containing protein [Desarmillaria tabescens]|uniref:Transcriptional regulator of RNA polII, SAGA, subunit-domain-containing protein n=1 Tax=Armillaria tabescens TaxID=1929756 RepID=A0AA39KAM2_ARMTA|nr:transcriptional regulator of RNA polII, SAGA, subunit-domain-containing protein [Desarmillaria tabescens]KAK0457656.1 transcriptional regulator of RNA polII, SAGA, subunit-domain-containing protein [Desarmillaria tabescens]
MSLSSTSTIKQQISSQLGPKAPAYFEPLASFVIGKISRTEFEDSLKAVLDAPNLIQLHNALIISLFDARSFKRPLTPPPDLPKPPPRKRRRTLPVPSIRSERLKRWTVSVGKHERDRIAGLDSLPPPTGPRLDTDEVALERGVVLLPERGEPPGSRLAVQLATITRSPNVQHIADRINLICAQNNLGSPVKLKQLITHALTLTDKSLAISSISTASATSSSMLSTSAFDTLFAMAPAVLPNGSAAAMHLAVGDREEDEEDIALLKKPDVKDPRWQLVALLGERSTVKEMLRNGR